MARTLKDAVEASKHPRHRAAEIQRLLLKADEDFPLVFIVGEHGGISLIKTDVEDICRSLHLFYSQNLPHQCGMTGRRAAKKTAWIDRILDWHAEHFAKGSRGEQQINTENMM